MQNITNKLNNRAQLWGMLDYENELGETDRKEAMIKELVYCNILPQSATQRWNSGITQVVKHSHKFKVRAKSVENPKVDMFFIFKGQKYKFISYDFDYKNREFLEIFTELILE